MSQQKVDKYKQEKAHRAQTVKKQKRVRRVETIIIVAVIAAALVWFGVSVYRSNTETASTGSVYIDSKEVVDYMNDPTAATEADAAEEAAEETEEAIDEAESEGIDVGEVVIDETVGTGEEQVSE